MHKARQVGGANYDFQSAPRRRGGAGEISGKGIAAATFLMIF